MQYRKDRAGRDLSVLGYGCMRFSRKGAGVDLSKTETEIREAFSSGVNYYDTAYIYPGSEAALGTILERNGLRDRVNIATKLPQFLIGSRAAAERYFREELSRLRTDRVDYYLMHHLTDVAMWEKLKALGIPEWLEEQKRAGTIRNVGFSFHGNTDSFRKILSDYDWDICQIQYNYYDEVSQAGRDGLMAAAARGIPVVIMEPLRGGRLVNGLPAAARSVMDAGGRDWSPAEWGLRWLYDQPEVTVVLSGMNSLDMVRENCRVASVTEPGCLTGRDRAVLEQVTAAIRGAENVGCTGCRYCMPCPKGVDIPGAFRCWNAMAIESKTAGRFQYAQTVALTRSPAFATQCVGCGKCEQHCPQNIPIREKLKEADRALRPLPYKLGMDIARRFMFRKTREKKEDAS